MSQPTDFPRPAPDSPVPNSLSSGEAVPGDGAATRSLDDSWVPPPPDEAIPGGQGLGTRFGRPPSSDPVEGHESAQRLHLIDTQVGEAEDDLVPPEIPGFVIMGECGRGGMGIVYLAEQVDLGRRVALKFLKPELAGSASQRARLLVEATALARLQHPNIVQIFSTGTQEGRSFIVQEYVGGGSLDRRLRRQPAAARPAAEMVATLARAVEHAHGQRIIHRDLKPSNVLLTVDGVPKISDFGLAKQSDLDSGSNQTQSGAIVGSPSYMAPEQSLGKRGTIGPPTDIYALGAILYEMLTGRPPFLAASTLETLEQVRSSDPVPPRQLQPGLPRDLETICLKCLSKDPARRYAPAAALADDLDRFLEGRPILARPVSRAERLVKWVRRHPATAASLGVAALAASALVFGGLIYQGLLRAALKRAETSAELARKQEKRADARYRVARETLSKMLERLRDRDLRQTPRLKELERHQMDDALGFYREVAKDGENPDPAVRFDVAQASLESAVAQFTLGRAAEARDQADHAIAVLEGLVKEDPARAEHRLQLARGYRMRPTFGDQTAGPGVPSELERSAELLQELVEQDRENRTYRAELAVTYHNLAASFCHSQNRDRLARAEPLFRRAIDLRRGLLDRAPSTGDAPVRVRLADSLENLAVVLQQTEHKEEVPQLYAESRQLLEDALRFEPNSDDATLSLGFTLLNWGDFLSYDLASRRKAETLLAEAVARLGPVVAREPEWDRARSALVTCHAKLAELLGKEGRHAEAARQQEQVVAIAKPDEKEHYQFFLAKALARAGEHQKAWNIVEVLRPCLTKRPVVYHFQLAFVCSICLGAAEKDPGLSTQDRAEICSRYAVAAIELLRHALERLPVADRLAVRLAQFGDRDMAELRRRPEFQAFIAESAKADAARPGAALAPRGNK
ncbi:MAG: protein kinase domain-containing protein [Isosphaeraceae bacterium]